nr:hypothetical protein [uncultured Rhodopila sp.]
MPSASKPGQTLCASISIIETGLFHAIYRTDDASNDVRQLPAYQVGSSVSDAMRHIEESAHLLGYQTIVWDAD